MPSQTHASAGAGAAALIAASAAAAVVPAGAVPATGPVHAVLDAEVSVPAVRLTPDVTAAVKIISASAAKSYTIRPGDTLSSVARDLCGNAQDWTGIYEQNKREIADPDMVYPGQKVTFTCKELDIPVPAAATAAPKTAPAASPVPAQSSDPVTTTAASTGTGGSVPGGMLSCSGLEGLWEQAGGSAGEAFTAAEIAMAESGGNQYALSPTDDYGYWQINVSHGPAMATFDSIGNAKAAIAISDDGTNWSAWTTYETGAYAGRC